MTTTELSEHLHRLGVVSDTDPHALPLLDCVILGGWGHEYQAGARCGLLFGSESIVVTAVADGQSITLPYRQVRHFEISGAGEIQSGGGFIGGGLGPLGAAEGIAVATVLNSLTTRTGIDTLLNLKAETAQLLMAYLKETPQQLHIRLAAGLQRIESAQPSATETPSAASSSAEEIMKLAELHNGGALTDAEFAAAKQRIIDRI